MLPKCKTRLSATKLVLDAMSLAVREITQSFGLMWVANTNVWLRFRVGRQDVLTAAAAFKGERLSEGAAACPLWIARCGGGVGIKRPVVVCGLPSLVRIIKFHTLEELQGIRAEILLVDDSIVTDDKRLYSRDAVLCGGRRESKPSDHGALDNKIHPAKRGGRA